MVLARIGDAARLKADLHGPWQKRDREMRLTRWFEEFRDDVRFAVRQFKSSPGFTSSPSSRSRLASAPTARFSRLRTRPCSAHCHTRMPIAWSWCGSVLQRSLACRCRQSRFGISTSRIGRFERLGGINMGIGGGPLLEAPDGSLQSVDRQMVTARFFDALGVRPIAGRTFRLEEAADASASQLNSSRRSS